MQDIHGSQAEGQVRAHTRSVRLTPAVHLVSGDPVGAFAETRKAFDDRPGFGAFSFQTTLASPAEWVVDTLGEIVGQIKAEGRQERPIILPVPSAGYGDPDLPSRCVDALATTCLCPQELCFEFMDAALTLGAREAETYLRAFRQRGFRVAIDARQSWCAGLSGPVWLMVDTLRVPAEAVFSNVRLRDRIEFAHAAGVAVVAQNPRWRDGEQLAELGVHYGLTPKADA